MTNQASQDWEIQPLKLTKLLCNVTSVNATWESRTCEAIIQEFNKGKQESMNYISSNVPGLRSTIYKSIIYHRRKQSVERILELLGNPQNKVNISIIIFFLRIHPITGMPEIFAATTRKAYAIIEKYRDFNFSNTIAGRLISLEGIDEIEQRDVLGNSRLVRHIYKNPQLPNPFNFGCITASFIGKLRPTASILRLPCFNTGTENPRPIQRIQIVIRPSSILFKHRFRLKDYPNILEHLSAICTGGQTYEYRHDDDEINKILEIDSNIYTQNIQLLSLKEGLALNKILISEIMNMNFLNVASSSEEPKALDFYHHHLNEWNSGKCYQLIKASKLVMDWDKPPNFAAVAHAVKQHIGAKSRKKLEAYIFEFTCEFAETPKYSGKFLDYVHGMIVNDGKVYWRLNKLWYNIKADYCAQLQRHFVELLQECLLPEEDQRFPPLQKVWQKKMKEPDYNKLYSTEEGYIVGDKKTPRGIEVFDILLHRKDPSTTLLYHVKLKFGQNTRDACSQILNSAQLISGTLINNNSLETWDALDELFDKFSVEKKAMFGSSNIEFKEALFMSTLVYAVGHNVKSSLHEEKGFKWKVETGDLESRISELFKNPKSQEQFKNFDQQSLAERIFHDMEISKYICSNGIVNSNFLFSTKENFHLKTSNDNVEFIKAHQEVIYDNIVNIHKSNFKTLLPKMELLRTRTELERLGFRGEKFKICEIKRSE